MSNIVGTICFMQKWAYTFSSVVAYRWKCVDLARKTAEFSPSFNRNRWLRFPPHPYLSMTPTVAFRCSLHACSVWSVFLSARCAVALCKSLQRPGWVLRSLMVSETGAPGDVGAWTHMGTPRTAQGKDMVCCVLK